ncbi:hypothetical protein MYAM1_002568 [Malassezia yamatoensis]|uniref:Protein PBN1 n=1 Tax=Malassezia yamatoensis TaxID=253288 RepID=A0AAJ6CGY7_9BASI|nr:hypothetical protein MYAM1_002568 [Malassezia yamatoensis]
MGPIELEKPVGWAAKGTYEDEIQRTWWERNDYANSEHADGKSSSSHQSLCHGPACEHTAVLLQLEASPTQEETTDIPIPLHIRYHSAHLVRRESTAENVKLNTSASSSIAWPSSFQNLVSEWKHNVAPRIQRWKGNEYQSVPILSPAGPKIFAACDTPPNPSQWQQIDSHELLPNSHAHLRPDLNVLLAPPRPLYSLVTPLEIMSENQMQIPVGDVSWYPAVQLLSMLAILYSTWRIMQSVQRAVKSTS